MSVYDVVCKASLPQLHRIIIIRPSKTTRVRISSSYARNEFSEFLTFGVAGIIASEHKIQRNCSKSVEVGIPTISRGS
jgi:hypothetical protein